MVVLLVEFAFCVCWKERPRASISTESVAIVSFACRNRFGLLGVFFDRGFICLSCYGEELPTASDDEPEEKREQEACCDGDNEGFGRAVEFIGGGVFLWDVDDGVVVLIDFSLDFRM